MNRFSQVILVVALSVCSSWALAGSDAVKSGLTRANAAADQARAAFRKVQMAKAELNEPAALEAVKVAEAAAADAAEAAKIAEEAAKANPVQVEDDPEADVYLAESAQNAAAAAARDAAAAKRVAATLPGEIRAAAQREAEAAAQREAEAAAQREAEAAAAKQTAEANSTAATMEAAVPPPQINVTP